MKILRRKTYDDLLETLRDQGKAIDEQRETIDHQHATAVVLRESLIGMQRAHRDLLLATATALEDTDVSRHMVADELRNSASLMTDQLAVMEEYVLQRPQ